MQSSLDDIALFVQVVKHGNLAAAARYLGLPPATVTRRLQKLEHALGVKLLHRSARKCVLTHDGETYFDAYAELVGRFEAAQQQFNDGAQKLEGKLKVLAPVNISHGILGPMWVAFTRDYPQIELELHLSNHPMDIVEMQADLAVRIGRQSDSSLYQRRLGQIENVLVATQDYVAKHGLPEHPSELANHDLISLSMRTRWQLQNDSNGQSFTFYPRCRALVNDPLMVKYFVRDSQGIALAPLTEVKKELAGGELIRILPEWGGEVRDIFILWPGGRLLSQRAKCLRDYIYRYVQQHF